MKKKLLLIDTFNFLHRAYHAIPKTFRDKEGNPTNAIYGFTSMLINLFDQIQPNYVVAAMDNEEPTFRVENFTAYKAHRKPLEPNFEAQIAGAVEILDAFGIKNINLVGYEADDVIGTVAKQFAGLELNVIMVSNDHDLWQLINENVFVMTPSNGGSGDWIGADEVKKRMGFLPAQIIDYKALRGDASDNIPGVHGIGEKTAKKLIEEFGSIEKIYANIAKIEPASLREKLANNAEMATMSKNLATIDCDAPISLKLDECRYNDFNRSAVRDVLARYNFKSLIKRLGFDISSGKKEKEVDEDQLKLL